MTDSEKKEKPRYRIDLGAALLAIAKSKNIHSNQEKNDALRDLQTKTYYSDPEGHHYSADEVKNWKTANEIHLSTQDVLDFCAKKRNFIARIPADDYFNNFEVVKTHDGGLKFPDNRHWDMDFNLAHALFDDYSVRQHEAEIAEMRSKNPSGRYFISERDVWELITNNFYSYEEKWEDVQTYEDEHPTDYFNSKEYEKITNRPTVIDDSIGPQYMLNWCYREDLVMATEDGKIPEDGIEVMLDGRYGTPDFGFADEAGFDRLQKVIDSADAALNRQYRSHYHEDAVSLYDEFQLKNPPKFNPDVFNEKAYQQKLDGLRLKNKPKYYIDKESIEKIALKALQESPFDRNFSKDFNATSVESRAVPFVKTALDGKIPEGSIEVVMVNEPLSHISPGEYCAEDLKEVSDLIWAINTKHPATEAPDIRDFHLTHGDWEDIADASFYFADPQDKDKCQGIVDQILMKKPDPAVFDEFAYAHAVHKLKQESYQIHYPRGNNYYITPNDILTGKYSSADDVLRDCAAIVHLGVPPKGAIEIDIKTSQYHIQCSPQNLQKGETFLWALRHKQPLIKAPENLLIPFQVFGEKKDSINMVLNQNYKHHMTAENLNNIRQTYQKQHPLDDGDYSYVDYEFKLNNFEKSLIRNQFPEFADPQSNPVVAHFRDKYDIDFAKGIDERIDSDKPVMSEDDFLKLGDAMLKEFKPIAEMVCKQNGFALDDVYHGSIYDSDVISDWHLVMANDISHYKNMSELYKAFLNKARSDVDNERKYSEQLWQENKKDQLQFAIWKQRQDYTKGNYNFDNPEDWVFTKYFIPETKIQKFTQDFPDATPDDVIEAWQKNVETAKKVPAGAIEVVFNSYLKEHLQPEYSVADLPKVIKMINALISNNPDNELIDISKIGFDFPTKTEWKKCQKMIDQALGKDKASEQKEQKSFVR